MLEDNSFAVLVVGDMRINGVYIDLVSETINAFRFAGLEYYNQLIYLQSPVTAAMTAERSMNSSRKIPKCHQNVLVFVKGNPFISAERMGEFK
jgi:hypothetical protein